MKITCKLSALTLSLIGLCSFASSALAKGSDLDAVEQNGARHVMQEYAVPGLVIAASANGKQHFYSFGVASKASKEPVTPDTLFEVGSVSKLFTATLATYAQANGQLSLTNTVSTYLPELRNTPFGNVTLIGLATHTAGGFPLQVPDEVQNDAQLMDYLKAWQPTYPQGTQRSYANPSIGMLGVIAANRMNMPYTEAMQDHLLPALGMKSSYLQIPDSEMHRYAQGYNKEDAPVRLGAGVLADEAYGLKTSARDLIHFAELNAGLGQVSPPLRRALDTTHTGYFRAGPMTQDLVGGQIDLYLGAMGANSPGMVAAGKLKLLAIISPERLDTYRNVPSVRDSRSLQDFTYSLWVGLFVRKGTPVLWEITSDRFVKNYLAVA